MADLNGLVGLYLNRQTVFSGLLILFLIFPWLFSLLNLFTIEHAPGEWKLKNSNRIINSIVIEHKFFHTFDEDSFNFVSDELKPNSPFLKL